MFRKWLGDIEGTLMLLFGGMVWFTIVLIFVEYRFNNDAQVFQVVAGLVTGFAGAFFAMVKQRIDGRPQPPPAPGAAPPTEHQ